MKQDKNSDSKNTSSSTRNRNNLYLVLDILPGASHNDILHAYNRAKTTYSSGSLASYSLIEDDSGSSILDEIEKAFEILGTPARRREYDLEMGFNTWSEEKSTSKAGALSPSIVSREHRNVESLPQTTPPKVKLEVLSSTSVRFESNPEFEKQISECVDISGSFLRAVRLYRHMTPEQVAHRCKLSASHVLAVEEEDHSKLHHPTYLRGHLWMICSALELPSPEKLAHAYVERMKTEGKIGKAHF